MRYLVAARMVDTAGGATRASASAAMIVLASWCSRRSEDPPISSASEGLPPPLRAPGRTRVLYVLKEDTQAVILDSSWLATHCAALSLAQDFHPSKGGRTFRGA